MLFSSGEKNMLQQEKYQQNGWDSDLDCDFKLTKGAESSFDKIALPWFDSYDNVIGLHLFPCWRRT